VYRLTEERRRNIRQSTDRIARTVGDLAISRAFLRAEWTAIITREGGFTDRHRTYRPPSYPDICRSFSLPPVAAVGAGGILMTLRVHQLCAGERILLPNHFERVK
jgi:hypothetical protein